MAKTLTDFIDDHVKNKRIESYAEWVAAYGQDAEREYARRVAAADGDYAASRAHYGLQGAALREGGLTGSGYAAYLDGVAYSARSAAKSTALSERSAMEAENRRGYAAYINGGTGSPVADTSSALGKLLSVGIVDEGVATSYLIQLGLAEDEAKDLASLNRQIQKNSASVREYLLRLCTEKMYSYSVAYQYALDAGMSDAAAKDLASEVQAYRDAYFNARK